jgi:hypothetical protein
MRPVMTALIAGLMFSACSGSPAAPAAPPPPASVQPEGTVSTSSCSASGQVYRCGSFSGTARNMGSGCAANVRGVITTYATATNTSGLAPNTQVGSAPWTHVGLVRPNEQVAFDGGPITIGAPLFGGWSYQNSITWDSVACQ